MRKINCERKESKASAFKNKSFNRWSKILLGVALFFTLAPAAAVAAMEKYVLDFGGSNIHALHGKAATLMLKKTLREQYPWVNISDLELRRVFLVAKTKKGKGQAWLRVGPVVSKIHRVNGHPRVYRDDHRASYDSVRIDNPASDSWGAWQLFLEGKFKVRKVVLIVDNHDRDFWHGYHRKGGRYDWHQWRR